MKYLLILISVVLLSCSNNQQTSVPKLDERLPVHKNNVKIEKLSDELDHGLHRVIVDDTINLLIYRGVESVTMIQIKNK